MIRSFFSHHRALRAGLLCFGVLCAVSSIASAQFLGITIDGPSTIIGGANITYTISLINGNSSAITTGDLYDTLPSTETFVSLSASGFTCITPSVGAEGEIECTAGTVAANSTVVITLVANVTAGIASGTNITNYCYTAPFTEVSSTALVSGNADLNIIMTGPATSNAGANIVYTTSVTNNGPDTATPTVTDVTPSGLTFVSNTGGCVTAFPCILSSMVSGAYSAITSTYSTTGATTGTITNTAAVTSADTDSNLSDNTASQATLMIPQADVSVTNTASATALVGSNLTYTITVSNAGPSTAGIATVTDTLPAGTTFVSATPSVGTCSGTTTVSCTLATIASAGSATITLVVRLNTAGSISDTTIASSSTADPTPGNNSSTAVTTVIAPPTISKAFGASDIPLGGTTSLSFTIHNPNSATFLTGVGFSDTLPAGMIVATPNGFTGGCPVPTRTLRAGSHALHPDGPPPGATITAVAGSGTVSLSGAVLAANGSCTFSITVQGTTIGTKANYTSLISSNQGSTGPSATAVVNVDPIQPPTINKVFGAASIPLNGTTSLSFTIHNTNSLTFLSAIGFTDVLPAGLIIATPNGLAAGCTNPPPGITEPDSGGLEAKNAPPPSVITAIAGSSTVSLSGARLGPNGSCTFSITVQGITAGTKTNITSTISSAQGGAGAPATANLTVIPTQPPTIGKAFGAGSIPFNGTTSLGFTIHNPNSATTLTAIGFSDVLPAGLIVSIPNGLTGTCGGGAITAVAGSGSVSLAGAALAGSGSCEFSVTVKGTTAGVKTNITSAISSTEGGAGTTASASVTVDPIPPPTVGFTYPANQAVNIPINAALSATFSKPMNPSTINTSTFSLMRGGTSVAGTVTYAGGAAIFTPSSTLAPNTLFIATITTGVTDPAGNALASNYVWSFTTTANTTPPVVTATVPPNGATLVTPSANVTVNFSELMNPLTVNTATFILQQVTTPVTTPGTKPGAGTVTNSHGTTPVPGTVTYSGTSATFIPTNNLSPNTRYNAVITDTSTDVSGYSLAASYAWSFTTGASADQAPVCLADFAILSGSAIDNSGPTVVTGDIGASSAGSVTGFPPGTLSGTIHSGDAVEAKAMLDLTAGYADAVLRSVGAVAVAGDLGGQTFTAGLYKSVSSLSISSGNLTLDAKGDPNAVFIFQIASTLTTAAGSQIILAGGASAFNVFWQVGTSATLGANSVLNGSILAYQSITLNTGATVNGRLLAQNGTVTLESNTVNSPPPGIAVGGIVNAASEARTAVAGSIESIFGHNLGSSLVLSTGYPLSTTLGGSSFQIGTQAAPLYMTSCSQQNLQIPWGAEGQVTVTATVGGLVSPQETLTLTPFAPGIFTLNQSGSGQGVVEIVPTSQLAAPLGSGGRPVKPGEYIAIFCTGLGPVSNQPATGAAALSDPLSSTLTLATVTIGGAPAKVTYSGLAPGFAGLYQVNALVPDGVPPGDSVNLVISIGGVRSNTVTIAIQ